MSDAPSTTKSFDLTGIGEVAKAIPSQSWHELVLTVTNTFKELIRPITALTGGLGGLIEQKFANMSDIQKILLADGLEKVRAKIELQHDSNHAPGPPRLTILADLLDEVSLANEDLTRQMWVNLLVTEVVEKDVHPEFINVLKRLAPNDAKLLLRITSEYKAKRQEAVLTRYLYGLNSITDTHTEGIAGLMWTAFSHEEKFDLSLTVLIALRLVEDESGVNVLTKFGEAFLAAVGEKRSS